MIKDIFTCATSKSIIWIYVKNLSSSFGCLGRQVEQDSTLVADKMDFPQQVKIWELKGLGEPILRKYCVRGIGISLKNNFSYGRISSNINLSSNFS